MEASQWEHSDEVFTELAQKGKNSQSAKLSGDSLLHLLTLGSDQHFK